MRSLSVELVREPSPVPYCIASRNSSRSEWFSIMSASASVSQMTVPSESIQVRRMSPSSRSSKYSRPFSSTPCAARRASARSWVVCWPEK